MRISDWSSDVCSSDLAVDHGVFVDRLGGADERRHVKPVEAPVRELRQEVSEVARAVPVLAAPGVVGRELALGDEVDGGLLFTVGVVEIGKHTSELQSLMRISYAVFCLKKKKDKNTS